MKLTNIKQGSEPVGDGGDQYTGWDRFGRVIDQRWVKSSSGADLERVQYGFDRADNRLWRKNVVAATGQDEFYGYDGLDQLQALQRGTLNSGKTGISGTPSWEEDLTFDPTGNWDNYVSEVNGTPTLNQPRTHSPANAILTISGTGALIVHDGAGNMIKAPEVTDWSSANAMIYDGWNRLVEVLDDDGTAVAAYGYDGQNRRVTKTTGTTVRHYYYTTQWQIIEERVGGATSADRQFVWGLRYLDDLVLRDRGSERFYALHDYFNCTAVADTSGTVQERYGYNAFGAPRVMTAAFGSRSGSSYDWETLFADYRWDSESGFYQVRYRYLHPTLGRWTSRDPIEYEAGVNLYCYCKNRSVNAVDPDGLDCPGCDDVPGVVQTHCVLRCCAQHDQCYDIHHCHASSWFKTLLKAVCCAAGVKHCCRYTPCQQCNVSVLSCISSCIGGTGPKSGPLYYCAKQHRFITIGKGGDFPTLKKAKKCCCT
jgi:RHS repeat-associated protein